MPKKIEKNNKDLENSVQDSEKNIAALSYAWILCLVPLLGSTKSEYAQFHAKQGLIILGLSLFTIVPILGWILGLVLLIISIMGIIKALNGEWWKIPYVYNWSKKISLNNK